MYFKKKRVLFIIQEFSPYLAITEFSEFINKLAVGINSSDLEVRCIMPRFGTINEHRYRLHEVLRLTGINIFINNQDYPLQIKVASLPHSRLQVYFLDNYELFQREGLFHDSTNENWYEDNGLRSFFFCKGVMETVKKFGWAPDIIHCAGWFSGFIPLLVKKGYKKEPIFSNAKIIYSIYESAFQEHFEPNIIRIIKSNLQIKENILSFLKPLDYHALLDGIISHSDSVILDEDNMERKTKIFLNQFAGKKIIRPEHEWGIKEFLAHYHKLTSK